MEEPEEVSDLIYKCANSIKTSSTDTEKLAGLFVAAQALKRIDNDMLKHASKLVVLDSIGPRFLVRLLGSKDSPEYHMFQSVAFSILNAFVSEKDLAAHPFVLAAVPQVVSVLVERAGYEGEQRLILDEAFEFITAVAMNNEGRDVLVKCDTVNRTMAACFKGHFSDRDLILISSLIQPSSQIDYELFHKVLNKTVFLLAEDNTQRKFELCSVINTLLVNCDKGALLSSRKGSDDWPEKAKNVISRILSSRLGENQRNPTLKLASPMLEIFGTDWALAPRDMDKSFFLLVAHLSAVEVRMQLEDRTLDVIMKNVDLIIACFVILEVSLSYVSTESSVLTEDETGQLLKVGQESLICVVQVYKQMEKTRKGEQEDTFKLALARAIVAWLAHEANCRLPEVQDVLPPLIRMTSDSFYAYQCWLESGNASEKGSVDLLRLLLPGLCHLSAEPESRKFFEDLETESVLLKCFKFHWKRTRGVDQEEYKEDSETALISLCNTFLNLCFQMEPSESPRGQSNNFHSSLLEYINAHFSDFSSTSLLLKGHLVVLGLVLVQQRTKAVKFVDLETFFQDSVAFFESMFSIQEHHLKISPSYRTYSDQFVELWTLGVTVLSSILPAIPQLSELIARWVEDLIDSLLARNLDDVPPNFSVQVENLFLSLLQTTSHNRFQDSKTLAACRRHNLKQLGCILFANEFPT